MAKDGGKLLTFTGDAGADQPFTKQVTEALKDFPQLAVGDLKGAISRAYRVKTEPELRNQETAAKLLKELYLELENKVLDVVNEGSRVRQSDLAAKIEGMMENDRKLKDLAAKVDGVAQFLDLPSSVLIQSGAGIELGKVQQATADETLDHNTIVMNISAKYKDACAMVARTILVNSTPVQKAAY